LQEAWELGHGSVDHPSGAADISLKAGEWGQGGRAAIAGKGRGSKESFDPAVKILTLVLRRQ